MEIRRRLDLPDRFILHVSTYTHARKNAYELAEAAVAAGLPLVIAGSTGGSVDLPRLERLRSFARQHRNIVLLGYQDQSTLNSLYAACDTFCLPSFHEGTGLAALEAGSYGAKVVITKHGGAPDYFGERALYVDGGDVADIERALREAWELPRSNALREHILQNLTWRHSAEALAACLHEARPPLTFATPVLGLCWLQPPKSFN